MSHCVINKVELTYTQHTWGYPCYKGSNGFYYTMQEGTLYRTCKLYEPQWEVDQKHFEWKEVA